MRFLVALASIVFLAVLPSKFLKSSQEPAVIMVEDDAGAWSGPGGTGYANELIKTAFAAVNVDVRLEVVPYARCKYNVMEGKVAACASMSWQPEFKGAVLFPKRALFECQSDFYQRSDKPLKFKAADHIPIGTRIGIVSEYEYPPLIATLRAKGVELEGALSEVVNIKKLMAGRLDAVLLNHNDIKTVEGIALKAKIDPSKLRRTATAGTLFSHLGFSTKHPAAGNLLKEFERGFELIHKSGKDQEIKSRWIRHHKEGL